MAIQRYERVPLTEENILRSPKSVELLIQSLQQVVKRGRIAPAITRSMLIELTGFDPEYLFDPEILLHIIHLDPSVARNSKADLVRLLDLFSIELEQLDFTEKLIGLEQIKIRALLPESTNAVIPMARMLGGNAGKNVGFN